MLPTPRTGVHSAARSIELQEENACGDVPQGLMPFRQVRPLRLRQRSSPPGTNTDLPWRMIALLLALIGATVRTRCSTGASTVAVNSRGARHSWHDWPSAQTRPLKVSRSGMYPGDGSDCQVRPPSCVTWYCAPKLKPTSLVANRTGPFGGGVACSAV